MHEMGVTRDIVDTVLETAEKAGATSVKRVCLTIGYARDVVDTIMESMFHFLARGTIAQHAELIIERVPFTVRCDGCGLVHPIDVHKEDTWPCPVCHSKSYKLASGMEFRIDNIEVGFDDGDEPAGQADAAPCAAVA